MFNFFPGKKPETIGDIAAPHFSQFDPNTGLYTFSHYMTELQTILTTQRALGLIFIDASDLSKIECDYGHAVYNQTLKDLVVAIQSLKGTLVRADDILAVRHPHDELFLLFLSGHRSENPGFLKTENLHGIIERFVHSLNAKVFEITFPYTKRILKTDIGYAYAMHNPLLSPERIVYRLIENAKAVANFNGQKFLLQINEALKEIIMEENIFTYFQPIIDLKDGGIFAYEALSRGPKGSSMESPLMLFSVAETAQLSFELDRLCRRKAIENGRGLSPHQKLFINTFPTTMHDPEFKGEPLRKLLERSNFSGSNIVFEITERFAIENYALFQQEQSYYSSLGFDLAVDDIGTGYGSLEAIANLKPQFVKVDISIIRGIHQSPVKQELLKAIRDIGQKVNAKIVAEGIEQKNELDCIRELGIDYGQGYLLARPSQDLRDPDVRFKLD
jgi:EAL domain-containing protein (putative c-di-GMP-specific phosphodiesterase class I)/GGDEF domain-containing protein